MDIDIFETALKPVAGNEAEQKEAAILFTEYRAQLVSRGLTHDELLDVAANSMVNAEQDAGRNRLNISILNKIVDDYEAREMKFARLPWDEIKADLQRRIEEMNAPDREHALCALALGIEIREKALRK